MRNIRYCFKNFWKGNDLEETWYYKFLSKYCNPVYDAVTPQIVIASIFGNEPIPRNAKTLLLIGESMRWGYDLSFRPNVYIVGHQDFGDIRFNVPFFKDTPEEYRKICHYIKHMPLYGGRDKFCCAVISNGFMTDGYRNNFIKELSKYKQVDMGGAFNNNIGQVIPRGIEYKLPFLSNYKFNIAMENSLECNYHTEKLLEGFAGGIPIYYGGLTNFNWLNSIFNVERLIFASPDNTEKVIKEIEYLDNHEEEYVKKLSQPIFRDYSLLEKEIENLDKGIKEIIDNIEE